MYIQFKTTAETTKITTEICKLTIKEHLNGHGVVQYIVYIEGHPESYTISKETAQKINREFANWYDNPIIAI